MRRWMTWLLIPIGLSLVLAFAPVERAEAQCCGYAYPAYSSCYHPRSVHYAAPVPVVRYYRAPVYRAPVVVPRPVYRYHPYRAYYAPRPYLHYRVWW